MHARNILYLLFAFLFVNIIYAQTNTQNNPVTSEVGDYLSELKNYRYGESRYVQTRLDSVLRLIFEDQDLLYEIEKQFLDVLNSDATLAAKRYICEKLSIYGSERSLPVLQNLLDQQQTFEMALFALSRLNFEDIVPILHDRLESASGEQRIGLINTIGEKGNPGSVNVLISIADSDSGEESMAAINAIAKISDEQSLDYLATRIRDDEDALHDAVVEAFLVNAEAYLAKDEGDGVYHTYKWIFENESRTHLQFAALRGMILAAPERSDKNISDILKNNTPHEVKMVIRLIKHLPEDQRLDGLVSMWKDLSVENRVELTGAVDLNKNSAARQILLKGLNDDASEVRIAAIESISGGSEPEFIPRLVELTQSGKRDERDAAREALIRMPGEKVDQGIRELIKPSDTNAKIELIRAAGERYDKKALPVVKSYLETDNQKVRLEAISAIRNIGGDQELELMVQQLAKSTNNKERDQLKRTVRTLAAQQRKNKADILINYFSECTSDENRAAFLQVMGALQDKSAVSFLRGFIQKGSPELQIEAVKAVEYWPDDTFNNDLLFIAEIAQNDKLRVLATRAYVRTIPFDTKSSGKKKAAFYDMAMRITKTTAEKKMILSALTSQPDIHAFRYASRFIKKSELKQEAVAAVITIATELPPRYSSVVLDVLESIKLDGEAEYLRERLNETIDDLSSRSDFIYQWQYAGPYKKEGADLLNYRFPPEQKDTEEIEWRKMPLNPNPEKYWYVPLDTKIGGDFQVVYLRTRVNSPRDQEVILELGSDDGIKVWLNDEMIHRIDGARGVVPGDDIVPARLKKGWNDLMIKVSNGTGNWGACARFRDTDGNRLSGLKYQLPM